jgi:hypothetical protein
MKKILLLALFVTLTNLSGTEDKITVAFSLNNRTNVYKVPNPKKYTLPAKILFKGNVVILYNELVDSYIRINYQGLEGWTNFDKLNLPDDIKQNIFYVETDIVEDKKQENYSSDVSKSITEKNKQESSNPKKTIKKVSQQSSSNINNKKVQKPKKPTNVITDQSKTSVEDVVDDSSPIIVKNEFRQVTKGIPWVYMILVLLITIFISVLLVRTYLENRKMNKLYKPIIDMDKTVEERKNQVKIEEKTIDDLKSNYSGKKEIYDSLIDEINILKDDLDIMAHGLYEPRFDFGTSEQFKERIKEIRSNQKVLIRSKLAVLVNKQWFIEGSKAEGTKATNRLIRLALRAFNGECDVIISKATWNNVWKMEERIDRSFDAINKMLEPNAMEISYEYKDQKDSELFATHEYKEKKYEEKEEIRRIRAEEKEEKKVIMEAEKARKKAENKQKLFEAALAEARKELGLLSDDEMKEKNEQIEELEQKLQDALKDKEKAISQAQLTKAGHVYVISNIGSFGENIYKIGLTRRLEPEIRVKELGDASVPFHFDIHAMIFSDDAPSLEHKLHEIFEEKRVNLVNRRKEFFKITLEDIEKEAKKINPEVEFYYTTESKEYKQTLALLKTKEEQLEELQEQKSKFPDSI